MKPTGACSKTPGAGLSGRGLRLRSWRLRQRWTALREMVASTQRCMTSVMSSSDSASSLRSSQISRSSTSDNVVVRVVGACERSVTVSRPRQRRMVVSLTPSSLARAAFDAALCWM